MYIYIDMYVQVFRVIYIYKDAVIDFNMVHISTYIYIYTKKYIYMYIHLLAQACCFSYRASDTSSILCLRRAPATHSKKKTVQSLGRAPATHDKENEQSLGRTPAPRGENRAC